MRFDPNQYSGARGGPGLPANCTLARDARATGRGSGAAGGASPDGQPWEDRALALFEAGSYDEAIALAEQNRSAANRHAQVVAFFSNLMKGMDERDRDAMVAWRTTYPALKEDVTAADIDVLHAFRRSEERHVRLYAEELLAQAYLTIGQIEDLERLVYYVRLDDPLARRQGLAGLARVLAAKRRIVWDGGTLPRADQLLFADEDLIRTLVQSLDDEVRTRRLGRFNPLDLARTDQGDAQTCLLLIETPAVPLLRQAAEGGNDLAEIVLENVQPVIDYRLELHPRSNWASASGEPPVAGWLGPWCQRCSIQLRLGSNFCTQCGSSMAPEERHACVGCGRALEASARFCPGCGRRVEAGGGEQPGAICSNPVCGAQLQPGARFCPTCGTPAPR